MESITTITKPTSHYVTSIVESVESGEVNPIDVFVNLKKVEKVIDGVMKSSVVQNAVTREYQKYNTREVDFKGVTISQSEAGVKFDYSGCQDPVILELEEKKKEIDERLKERQKFLKNIPPEGMTIIDENTGEVITLYPPSRSSSTIIKATVK